MKVKRLNYNYCCGGATENAKWKMRYGQKSKGGKCGNRKIGSRSQGGKCRSRLAVWKAEPILYSDTALSYFLKIVFRLLGE